jgi:hypothetical protein
LVLGEQLEEAALAVGEAFESLAGGHARTVRRYAVRDQCARGRPAPGASALTNLFSIHESYEPTKLGSRVATAFRERDEAMGIVYAYSRNLR